MNVSHDFIIVKNSLFYKSFLVVKRMVSGDFTNPVSTLDAPTKDIKLGLSLGESVSANMPLGELCAPFFTEGQELGFGGLDSAAVYKVFEAREGGR